MHAGEKISGEFVVAGCDTAKVLEPAKAAFDDIAALVRLLIEAMEGHTVGFVGYDRACTKFDDLRAKVVAVICFVGDERAQVGRKRQDAWSGDDVGILAGCQMKNAWPAARIA